ncbi:MAG TPA: type II toxin-antitoxin system RelE/ParE family toxin [Silvibacterium sp.]|nr:type II toxin-antitoxin system RelE/ParE family toxin [Silvibacterium sp.]
MRKRYILSPEAIDDLSEIWRYIAKQSGAAIADQLEEEFFGTFDLLTQFPRAGHPRIDLTNRPVLFFPARKYMVIYQDTSDELIVHAVLHSARNLKRVLRRRKQ